MKTHLRLGMLLSLLLTLVLSGTALADAPTVTTDKPDYHPGELVIISGSGYSAGAALTVRVTWPQPDGRVDSAAVNADGSGAFVYAYQLGLDGLEDMYTVDVLDTGGAVLATTTFTDSHFRFGHITWTRAPGTRDVTFTILTAWRLGTSTSFINFGDGSPQVNGAGTLIAQPLDSLGVQYDLRSLVVTHTYPNDGPFTALFSSCCRIHGLINASSASWRVATIVNLASANQGSPVSSISPISQMVQGGFNSIPLPVGDPDGDPITCRMATTAESSIPSVPSAGGHTLGVTSGCDLQWDTSGTAVGDQYAAQVIIEENNNGNIVSVALDFIIEITGGTLNGPPTCVLGGGASNNLTVGLPFSISALGTDPDGDSLTISHLGLPGASTLTPPSGPSPLAGTFNWTPTSADAGAYVVTIIFSDPSHLQNQCSFSMRVPPPQPVLAIELASFTASGAQNDATLAWETGSEIDNAGFNLYRSTSEEGPYELVTDLMIAAKANQGFGATYDLVDAVNPGVYYYKLEDVDFDSTRTLHGPVMVIVGGETVFLPQILDK